MQCKICKNLANKNFSAKVLNKYLVDYYHCDYCGFLFTQDPYWLKEAYERPINISDTGILNRNIFYSKMVSTLIYFFYNKNSKYLDYAGGYGLFTRLMRDVGFDFYWHDPYTQNLFANGFEYDPGTKQNFEVITAFEVFEHLVNPKDEISKMLEFSKTLFFSTEVLTEEIPKPNSWWYYGFEHGQHISFYAHKTLDFIAKEFNLNHYKVRDLHIFTFKELNENKLIFLSLLLKVGLHKIVKKRCSSKTFIDHLALRDKT